MSLDPSTSLSSQVPVQTSLTSDMMLGLKPSAPKSRSYRVNLPPSNKAVFTALDQMIFDVPTGRPGTWLDQSQSYLRFSVQFSSTAAANATYGGTGIYLDNTAYSFFQRMDIYHSSNLLESINEYGQLCNYVLDQQLSMSDKAALSPMIGSNPVNLFVNAVNPPALNSNVTPILEAGNRSGLAVGSVAGAYTGIPYTFTLPVMSGVIGVNASKMIPLKDLSSTLNVQFWLSNNDDAIYYGTAGAGATWQIVNAELCCQFVEINDDHFNSSSGTQYISTQSYRHVSSYLPAATSGQIDVLVGLRCSSLNQLIARFRPHSAAVQGVNATAAYRKSSSVSPNLSSYYWKVGTEMIPRKPVYLLNGSFCGTGAEGFAEISKSWHALGSMVCNGSITHTMYNVSRDAISGFAAMYGPTAKNATAVPDTAYNAFSLATELSVFSNKQDTILSGISTLNAPLYLTLVINNGATAASNFVVDIFGGLDMILVIENGIMSSKY
jgi:hypothetical protein